MAINFTVGDETPEQAEEQKLPEASMRLNARKTLDGSLAIYDHADIDIVVIPKSNKVLALTKDAMSDQVYDTQSRLFDFLVKKGVILPETVKAGNVYGSLEGVFPESQGQRKNDQVAIFTIGLFLEEEKPFYKAMDQMEQEMEDYFLEPEDEDTTEFGEVPQAEKKGSIPKGVERMHGYRVYESKE